MRVFSAAMSLVGYQRSQLWAVLFEVGLVLRLQLANDLFASVKHHRSKDVER